MDNDPVLAGARLAHVVFNAVEAAVWAAASVVVLWRRRRLAGTPRRVALVAGVALALFSASDVWEIRTGSWFEPVGLLALNVACVATLVPCLVYYYVLRRIAESDPTAPRPDAWGIAIKFACGAVVGLILGFMATAQFFRLDPERIMTGSTIGGVVAALVLGWLATKL